MSGKVFAPALLATAVALAVFTPGLHHTGTDAGLITEPATWGEVPVLPAQAYYTPSLCVPVPVLDTSEAALEYLLGQGWQGDSADGMEALYAPGCVAAA